MAFFRTSISWRDQLRWYERIALAVWWLGQAMAALCVAGAAWLLIAGNFNARDQSGMAALLLTGFFALAAGRAVLALATRRRRWRRLGPEGRHGGRRAA
jgi:hypothetical protein